MNRIKKKRRHCGLDPQSPARSMLFAVGAGLNPPLPSAGMTKWGNGMTAGRSDKKSHNLKSPPEGDLGGLK